MPQQAQLTWTDVESSNVKAIAYDKRTHVMCVRFKSGALYSYSGPTEEMYFDFVAAESIGKYLNNVIKVYPYTRWEDEKELLSFLVQSGEARS